MVREVTDSSETEGDDARRWCHTKVRPYKIGPDAVATRGKFKRGPKVELVSSPCLSCFEERLRTCRRFQVFMAPISSNWIWRMLVQLRGHTYACAAKLSEVIIDIFMCWVTWLVWEARQCPETKMHKTVSLPDILHILLYVHKDR
jgi:hypothetical protein